MLLAWCFDVLAWCFEVLNGPSRYWYQSLIVTRWKAKKGAWKNLLLPEYSQWLLWGDIIEAVNTSHLGQEKRVTKKHGFEIHIVTETKPSAAGTWKLAQCCTYVLTVSPRNFRFFEDFLQHQKPLKPKCFLGKTWNFQGLPIFKTSNN